MANVLRSLGLVKKVIYPRGWIVVLNSDLVEGLAVCAKLPFLLFLLRYKKDRRWGCARLDLTTSYVIFHSISTHEIIIG